MGIIFCRIKKNNARIFEVGCSSIDFITIACCVCKVAIEKLQKERGCSYSAAMNIVIDGIRDGSSLLK